MGIIKTERDQLQRDLMIEERIIDSIPPKFKSMKYKQNLRFELDRYRADNIKLKYEMKCLDRDRIEDQSRLALLEIELVDREIQEEQENKENTRVNGEYLRCKLCFHRDIEYVLLPCLHLAYCEICVNRLQECAIRRKPVTMKIKVNLC